MYITIQCVLYIGYVVQNSTVAHNLPFGIQQDLDSENLQFSLVFIWISSKTVTILHVHA